MPLADRPNSSQVAGSAEGSESLGSPPVDPKATLLVVDDEAAVRRVLVPATPGVKRLQAIVYTQLQRAMLGELSSDAALAQAEREWNRYAAARWP